MEYEFITCECSTHALQVEYVKEDQNYNLCIWQYGHYGSVPMSWKERLRWCWRVLKTGNPWADSIILSKEKRDKLVQLLTADEEKVLLKG